MKKLLISFGLTIGICVVMYVTVTLIVYAVILLSSVADIHTILNCLIGTLAFLIAWMFVHYFVTGGK